MKCACIKDITTWTPWRTQPVYKLLHFVSSLWNIICMQCTRYDGMYYFSKLVFHKQSRKDLTKNNFLLQCFGISWYLEAASSWCSRWLYPLKEGGRFDPCAKGFSLWSHFLTVSVDTGSLWVSTPATLKQQIVPWLATKVIFVIVTEE